MSKWDNLSIHWMIVNKIWLNDKQLSKSIYPNETVNIELRHLLFTRENNGLNETIRV